MMVKEIDTFTNSLGGCRKTRICVVAVILPHGSVCVLGARRRAHGKGPIFQCAKMLKIF